MYDYVIVGAGSAGCTLAARLTEDPSLSVLLVEAGPPDTKDRIQVPVAYTTLYKTDVDWDYATAPQPGCGGRTIELPQGKTLGGSSSINAMVYIRGNRADYDAWSETGLDGWSYADLLPLFKRSEDNERGASDYHGVGGPLAVADSRSSNPMAQAWVEAAVEVGHQANDDFNGAAQDGVGLYQATQRDGRRCSAAAAFLHPALERRNLALETRLQIHRVRVEGARAVGVVGERCGELVEFEAAREVVLCAGAYNSPKLLLLSGLGPADHLRKRGIDVRVDLPAVGQNLQDHLNSGVVYATDEPVSLLLASSTESLRAFAEEGRGPLTSNVAEAGGFWRSDPSLPAPDVQFHCAPTMVVEDGDPSSHGISFVAGLLTPTGRGCVALRSNDPSAKPWIRHGFLTDRDDVGVMCEGLKMAMEIAHAPAVRAYCQTPHLVPASTEARDLLSHVEHHSRTLSHPVGTCAMGKVVDAELRVYGVEGLRVVDASVMPVIPRGNTNAPTIAIAERAAELVRDA